MDRILIAPSTDPTKSEDDLLSYVREIQDYADFLHCDVMDGVFVPRKTISYETILLLKRNCLLPLDVHLMVQNPLDEIEKYAKSGANIITIHYESFSCKTEIEKAVREIKKMGCLAGISIKPNTQIKEISSLLPTIDLVLVMSVEPGKSGQSFIPETLSKVFELSEAKNEYGYNFLIEVDGGVNKANSLQLINNGANVLVSGSYVYSSADKNEAIESLRG